MTEPDPFAQPVTFSSGVRWAPDDYKPLTAEARATYRKFAAKPTSRTVSNGAVTR